MNASLAISPRLALPRERAGCGTPSPLRMNLSRPKAKPTTLCKTFTLGCDDPASCAAGLRGVASSVMPRGRRSDAAGSPSPRLVRPLAEWIGEASALAKAKALADEGYLGSGGLRTLPR